MAGQTPFTNLDPATAADAMRRGSDVRELDQAMERILLCTYANLPDFPVYSCHLRPSLADPGGVDRISHLPRALLHDIVSRLPVKEAARTAVLSSRWRRIWVATPLVLNDAHFLPKGHCWPLTPANSPAITAAVSRILEAHLGPIDRVRLVCTNMNSYRPQLARWLQLLAAKGVQELVLVNRPWPRDLPLPATVFAITTLTRLYLGVWKLPDTAVLRGASFPHLRELGLCCVQMEHGDVDSLVARSPVLEILNILGCLKGLRLRLVSQSLRCVQISGSIVENIAVVKAPCLERLILYASCTPCGLCTRVKIGDAPKLHAFGYLQPGQVLEIRDTVIMSKKCDQPTGHLTLKFWQESGPIENVTSCMNTMSIREFRGEPGEVGFLEYIFQSTRALSTAVVVMANPSFAPFSTKEAYSKVKKCYKDMASDSCTHLVLESNGGAGGEIWRFKDGADFSFHDPFSVAEVRRPLS
ncbi:hypothetical protein ACQ4PT_055153 [Festuca glaucescens]